jgi:plasmid stabilization system protein ParE
VTYRLTVRRQAKADIREAARWYERQRHGLGRAFLRQIDMLLDRIREDPLQHQVVYRGVRRAIPRRFPYGLFYRIDGLAVLVFAEV